MGGSANQALPVRRTAQGFASSNAGGLPPYGQSGARAAPAPAPTVLPVPRLVPSVFVLVLAAAAACGRSTPVRYAPDPQDPQDEPAPPAPTPTGPVANPFAQPFPPPPPPPICEATESERFTLPPRVRRPIDVLFVIDDSCSMENDQQALADNFGAFIGAFQQNQVDFHLGVVTTDMNDPLRSGRLVAPFLTQDTLQLEQAFQSMVRVGTRGSAIERGLLAASTALKEPVASGANRGFVRDDSDFALVFLGDEDDQSTLDLTFFADELEALKRDTFVTVGTIIVGRCSPTLVDDWRLVRFARRFAKRGVTRLCTSKYDGTLRSIAGRIVDGRCTVGLRKEVGDWQRVRVTVNGAPATYRLDPPDDAFPFGSLEVSPCPEAGGEVELTYEDCRPASGP